MKKLVLALALSASCAMAYAQTMGEAESERVLSVLRPMMEPNMRIGNVKVNSLTQSGDSLKVDFTDNFSLIGRTTLLNYSHYDGVNGIGFSINTNFELGVQFKF